ncbi:MAG: hypothetical protein GY847_41515 [Proteobacteria bacterium]|nr:hypothetical protein [Pseudomonadota bacterium]
MRNRSHHRTAFPKSIAAGIWLVSFTMLLALQGHADIHEDEARTQFEQGKELFNRGRYEQAAIALKRAYELRPSHKILYYIGWAEIENESYARALNAFTLYLDSAADMISPKRAQEVAAEIERLEALVGWIDVDCDLPGATVMIDGERMSMTPLGTTIAVDLGKHEILVKNQGEEIHSELIRVAGGQRVIVDACSGSSEGISLEAEDELEKTKRFWTWIAFGMGGATAVTSVITGSVALSMTKDVESKCNGDLCSPEVEGKARKVTKLSWATNGLIGAAIVGTACGIILYFIEPGMTSGKERALVTPVLTPHTKGLSISVRF